MSFFLIGLAAGTFAWLFIGLIFHVVERYRAPKHPDRYCRDCAHGIKGALFWKCDLNRDIVSGEPKDCEYYRLWECDGKYWKKKDE